MEEQVLLRNLHLVDPRVGRRDPEEIPYFSGGVKWRIGFENGRPRPVGSYLTFDYLFSSRANSSGNNTDYTNKNVANPKNGTFLVKTISLVGIPYTNVPNASKLSSQQPALISLEADNGFNVILPSHYHHTHGAANTSYNNVVNTRLGYGVVIAAQAVNTSSNVPSKHSTSKTAKQKEITNKSAESGKNVAVASKNISENRSTTKTESPYISEEMFSLFGKSSESCFIPFWMERDHELLYLLDEVGSFLKSRNIQVDIVDITSEADSSNNLVKDDNLTKESSAVNTVYREYISSTIDVINYVLEFADQDLFTPEEEEEIFDALQELDDNLNELYPDIEVTEAEYLEDSQLPQEIITEDDITVVSLKKKGSMKFDSVRLTENLKRLSVDADRLSVDASKILESKNNVTEVEQDSILSMGKSGDVPSYIDQELSPEGVEKLEAVGLRPIEKKLFGSFKLLRSTSKKLLRNSLESYKSSEDMEEGPEDMEEAYLLWGNDLAQKEDLPEIFENNIMLGRGKQRVPLSGLFYEAQEKGNEGALVSSRSQVHATECSSKEVPPMSEEEEEFFNSFLARMRGGTIQVYDNGSDKQGNGLFTERNSYPVSSSEFDNVGEPDIVGKSELYDF